MIIRYTYGFTYKGILYGWKDAELYKLPQTINNRFYSGGKVSKWKDKGYYVGRDKKSFSQLKAMTIFINVEVQEIKNCDVPF